MAGIRQHVIPRFLLRGFQSDERKRNTYTYVYRKNSLPFETNIINVGVDKDFYSDELGNDVDEKITESESKFGNMINKLRQSCSIDEIDRREIAYLLAHLEVRTRHLREVITKSSDYISTNIYGLLGNHIFMREYLTELYRRKPELIEAHLKLESRKLGIKLTKGNKKIIFKALKKEMPQFISEIAIRLSEDLSRNRDDYIARFKSASKKGHLEALRKAISPELRQRNFSRFNYYMCEFEEDSLILGDCGLLLKGGFDRRYKTIWEKDDPVDSVYLPISSNKLIYGRLSDSKIDLEEINENMAACSLEYFVASSDRMAYLSEKISTNAYMLSKNQMDRIVSSIFEGQFD